SPYMYVAGDPVNDVDPDGQVITGAYVTLGRMFFLNSQYKVIGSVAYDGDLRQAFSSMMLRYMFSEGYPGPKNKYYLPVVHDGPDSVHLLSKSRYDAFVKWFNRLGEIDHGGPSLNRDRISARFNILNPAMNVERRWSALRRLELVRGKYAPSEWDSLRFSYG